VAQWSIVAEAFKAWDDVSGLTFCELEADEAEDADIRITFVIDGHGDRIPITDSCRPLGHAFFPGTRCEPLDDALCGGQIHLCQKGDWNIAPAAGQDDLSFVVLHEIGHALGLEHTDPDAFPASVMSYVCPNPAADCLDEEDIAAIRRLYGSDDGTVPPVPTRNPPTLDDPGDFPPPPDLSDPNDPDSDEDGIPDTLEILALGTDPFKPDTDDDFVDDFTEVFVDGTDPTSHSSVAGEPDTDGDRLTDVQELDKGTFTDDSDTDDDGVCDGLEIPFGTDPLVADTDDDGLEDGDDCHPTIFEDAPTVCNVCPDLNCDAVPDDCECEADDDCDINERCDADTNTCIIILCTSDSDCDDNDACTIDTCDVDTGTCSTPPVDCDDGLLCTDDVCDAGTGQCANTPNDANCDPGEACDPTDPDSDPVTGCRLL